jgi:ppGpp synthetase/RelA/SpoT-type nucleotidyltranferase
MIDDLLSARVDAEIFAKHAADHLARSLHVLQNPGPAVSWRVKGEHGMREKLAKGRRVAAGKDREINDFIGIRIVVATVAEIAPALRLANRWFENNGLVKINLNDTIESPPPGGYRAIHVDYHFADSSTYHLPPSATLELQLTTELLFAHGALNRAVYHKHESHVKLQRQAFLDELSAMLYAQDLARVGTSNVLE